LSRRLADQAHYPAIDLNGSISRVMPALVSADELRQANHFRRLWSVYEQNADLVQVGAYERGSNPELDDAIRLREAMVGFLRQDMHLGEDYATCRDTLRQILS
jgi:flagellum-specific ATP synthase